MIIFVNATAADKGGLKTIVDQFLTFIKNKNDSNTYYVFVSTEQYIDFNFKGIKVLNVNKKRWIKRIIWDSYGLKRWSERNDIIPDKIISLQNTTVNYSEKVEQIVYLHTPIPFVNHKWKFFKKNELKLWLYKNIYPYFITFYKNQNTFFIVQTNWLKKALNKKLNINLENIKVIRPNVEIEKNMDEKIINFKKGNKTKVFFYPAMDYVYKNHTVLLEALKIIEDIDCELYRQIKITFTLDDKSDVFIKAERLGLTQKIKFLGNIPFSEVLKNYSKADAVLFPSYIETFGLPLIEAANYSKKIICADEEYSREVIGKYKGASFVNSMSANEWAKEIIHFCKSENNNELYNYEFSNLSDTWEVFYNQTLK
ncbi:glycosyltransferase [Domibacillus enclensis]|uniref:Glycosyltransferase involved in cell wall bisynthesis n=1 Tax=Domibacillus enclensis TaxID=1017273 RepID=A0A1N6RPK3_9BACI|nr:glycosyltransferase [Domibacillus enclensis]OXS79115.1 hypothetical protein B1B05_04875 [Domibacillus enclensis]SIQ30810.1 Glycosyltransferase involved in cell wall bisynthesis [Domibacillus enclensis]